MIVNFARIKVKSTATVGMAQKYGFIAVNNWATLV